MTLNIRDIKKLDFDDAWQICEVGLACAANAKVNVYFGADEIVKNNTWMPLPPTRLQIETLLFIGDLPRNFVKSQSQLIRQYCQERLESAEFKLEGKIDLFRIEQYCQVREVIVPYIKSARKHNYILSCQCDWQPGTVMNLHCRDRKILKVSNGEMSRQMAAISPS